VVPALVTVEEVLLLRAEALVGHPSGEGGQSEEHHPEPSAARNEPASSPPRMIRSKRFSVSLFCCIDSLYSTRDAACFFSRLSSGPWGLEGWQVEL